jgi:hypothetical protein
MSWPQSSDVNQTAVNAQAAEIARLLAALERARPYVEHCAEPGGSDVADAVLREIDGLANRLDDFRDAT